MIARDPPMSIPPEDRLGSNPMRESWQTKEHKLTFQKLAIDLTNDGLQTRSHRLSQGSVFLICPGQVFVKEPAVFHSHWSCTQRVSCSFRVNSRLWWQESNPSLQTRTASRTNSPVRMDIPRELFHDNEDLDASSLRVHGPVTNFVNQS